MRAYEKKKLTRKVWASKMREGLINDASTGHWGKQSGIGASTTHQHNYHGSHPK